ncbi:EpsG family protein [Butyrivibrio sp. FC2001]|uniref:EpsG family protein n=1 Tax=Butyrivibrio sp. FC2001 TaxID=1280671 RepID=UPI0004283911|nr:EpsG family protein [Butyrivibrio sp. FC2001]
MNVYTHVLVIIVLLSFFEVRIINNENKVLLNISRAVLPCAFLCCMAGVRSLNVGKDTYPYSRFFLGMTWEKVHVFDHNYYWAYNLWDYVLRYFTDNVFIFNICCAIFIYIALYNFIQNYSCDARVSLFLFISMGVFFTSMNQVRQTMATALLLFGFKYAVEKNIFKSMLICFLAIFVHNVAVVMIPVYALLCLIPRVSTKTVMLFSQFSLAIILLYNRLISLFVSIFPKYKSYLKYARLFVEKRSIYRYGDFLLALFVQIVFVWGIYRSRAKEVAISEKNHIEGNAEGNKTIKGNDKEFGNILACMNALYLCMTYLILNGDIFNRLKSTFVYWVLLTIPYIIKKFFNDNRLLKIIVCLASIAYMWRLGVHDGDGIIPYSVFFDWKRITFFS